jgi:proteic killer suppression protein
MIKNFNCKETERLFKGQFSKKLPQSIQRAAQRKLIQIHAATTLDFLRVPPANHLELLTGKFLAVN